MREIIHSQGLFTKYMPKEKGNPCFQKLISLIEYNDTTGKYLCGNPQKIVFICP